MLALDNKGAGGFRAPLWPLLIVAGGTSFLVLLVLASGSAAAWEEHSSEPIIGNFQTGEVYSNCGSAQAGQAQWHQYVNLYRDGCAFWDNFFAYDVSSFDKTSYVAGTRLAITFWPASTACSNVQWSLRPLYVDPLSFAPLGFDNLADHIEGNPNWLNFTNSHNDYRELDGGPEFLDYVRQSLEDGNSTLRFSLVQTSTCAEIGLYPATNLTLTLLFDNTPPATPATAANANISDGTYIFRWNATTDNDSWVSGYQAVWALDPGFLAIGGATDWLPNGTRAAFFDHLPDGRTAYFGVRARDGFNFTSAWSAPIAALVDTTPPTTPTLIVPRYFPTQTYSMSWIPSTDATSGVYAYRIEGFATNGRHEFSAWWVATNYPTNSRPFSISSSNANIDYRATITAFDFAGNPSATSDPVYFMWDNAPPTFVDLILEPLFSPGSINVISWNGSTDAGIGGVTYQAQASVDLSFVPLAGSVDIPGLGAAFGGLGHGQKYYYRVRALDAYGHPTDWSVTYSTQDAEAPSAVELQIPRWTNQPTVTALWTNSSDALSGLADYEVTGFKPDGSAAFARVAVANTSLSISTLEEGVDLTICVEAVDVAGLQGNASCAVVTADHTPPTMMPHPIPLPLVVPYGGIARVFGSATDGLSGVTRVEGGIMSSWSPAEETEEWNWTAGWVWPSVICTDYAEDRGAFLFRATDAAGNTRVWDGWVPYIRQLCDFPFEVLGPSPGEVVGGMVTILVKAPHQDGPVNFVALDRLDPDAQYGTGEAPSPPFPGGLVALRWNTTSLQGGNYSLRVQLSSGASIEVPVYVENAAFSIVNLFSIPAQPVTNSVVEVRYWLAVEGDGWSSPWRVVMEFFSPDLEWWVECRASHTFKPLLAGSSAVSSCLVEVGNWTSFTVSVTIISSAPGAPEVTMSREFVVTQPPEPPDGTDAPIVEAGEGSLGVVALAVSLLALGAALVAMALAFRRGRPPLSFADSGHTDDWRGAEETSKR